MNCDHKTFNSEQKKIIGKRGKKARVQDCVHNYTKSKGTTHPINHCECLSIDFQPNDSSVRFFFNLTFVIIIVFMLLIIVFYCSCLRVYRVFHITVSV